MFLALNCLIAASIGCSLATPSKAYADYSNPSISTVAQMRTDGVLHVVEQRSFSFMDDYSAITWRFTGLDSRQDVELSSVRMIRMDPEGNIIHDWITLKEVPFQPSWRDFIWETEGLESKVQAAEELAQLSDEGSSESAALPTGDAYTYDKRYKVLYVFLGYTDQGTVIEADYNITHAALIYDDTAELYWDYISSQQDVRTSNVHARIQLPVPEGAEVIPGQNVRAWGHGPEGTVEVRADGTVDLYVPTVRLGQYAQAHVLFPRSWLTNITVQSKLAKSGTRYDAAVAEETGWVDRYSAGLINGLTMNIVILAICLIALLAGLGAWMAFGRERPSGWRFEQTLGLPDAAEVNLHDFEPAVIGRLLRWNQHSSKDFVATVQGLVGKGVVQMVLPEGPVHDDGRSIYRQKARFSEGFLERAAQTRLRLSPSAKSTPMSELDRDALDVVFDVAGGGYQSVSIAEVAKYRERNEEPFREAMSKWQDMLSRQVAQVGLFDKTSYRAAAVVGAVGAVFVLAGIYGLIGSGDRVTSLVLLATGILLGAIAYNTPKRTELGVDLEEQAVEEGAFPVSNQQPTGESCGITQQAIEDDLSPATGAASSGIESCDDGNELKEAAWWLLEKTTSF